MSQNGNYDAHEIKADELLPVAQQEGDDGNAAAAAAIP